MLYNIRYIKIEQDRKINPVKLYYENIYSMNSCGKNTSIPSGMVNRE